MEPFNARALLCASGLAGLASAGMLYAAVHSADAPRPLWPDVVGVRTQALAADNKAPSWLSVPPRSNTPVVLAHARGNERGEVRFRTFLSAEEVARYYTTGLAASGLQLAALKPAGSTFSVASVQVGYDRASGREVEITIRDLGPARAVAIVYRGNQTPLRTAKADLNRQ